jgi:hypothetical protein
MFGALLMVGVELRGDAFDRVGDPVEPLHELDVTARERARRLVGDEIVVIVGYHHALGIEALPALEIGGPDGDRWAAHSVERLAERQHPLESGPFGEAAHEHHIRP